MATTTTGAFVESTKAQRKDLGQKGYVVGLSAESAVVANATDNIVSRVIGDTATAADLTLARNNGLCGNKVIVGWQTTTAFANVVATCILQGSYDGTNWITLATVASDTTPDVTGTYQTLVDLTSVKVPFIRLNFNPTGQAINTTGQLYFFYSIPIE
jgi:hypothetical protein